MFHFLFFRHDDDDDWIEFATWMFFLKGQMHTYFTQEPSNKEGDAERAGLLPSLDNINVSSHRDARSCDSVAQCFSICF